jgi:hypothetical protein
MFYSICFNGGGGGGVATKLAADMVAVVVLVTQRNGTGDSTRDALLH